MLKFNQQLLKQALEQMPVCSRVAFAASCAQRLVSVYHRYLAQIEQAGRASDCDRGLEYVWAHILTVPQTDVVQLMLADVMSLIPDQDAPGWTPLTAYGEDSLAALAYCLSSLLSGDSQEAVWAAVRVYEALDYFVDLRDRDDASFTEARVLADPLIQTEFARQARDLEELRQLGDALTQAFLDDLQRRSAQEQSFDFD